MVVKDFYNLYSKSPKIDRLKKQNSEEYLAFSTKEGYKVALTSAKEYLDAVPHEESYYAFFQECPIFWMIPVDYPGVEVPLGFVLRGFSKKSYRAVSSKSGPQLMYGWHTFGSFKRGDTIVLVEGVKDCEYLNKIHPYTLAVLSSAPSQESIHLLRSMTTRVILALDNDDTGKAQSRNVSKKLISLGVSTKIVLPDLAKDWGAYFKCDSMFDSVKRRFNAALSWM